jgi:hypothetical protein
MPSIKWTYKSSFPWLLNIVLPVSCEFCSELVCIALKEEEIKTDIFVKFFATQSLNFVTHIFLHVRLLNRFT